MHVGFGEYYQKNRDWYTKTKELAQERCKDSKASVALEETLMLIHQIQTLIHNTANQALTAVVSTRPNTMDSDPWEMVNDILEYSTIVFECSENSQVRDQARETIIEVLRSGNASQQESMFRDWVDHCYNGKEIVAREYLFAILTTLTEPGGVEYYYNLTSFLNLAFYSIGDPNLEVRKIGSERLHWLSTRFYRTREKTFQMHTSSQCSSQYLPQLVRLVGKFSRN